MAPRETVSWTLGRLLAEDLGPTVVWATPSVRKRSEALFPHPHRESLEEIGAGIRTLIAIGGGAWMDAAKRFRAAAARPLFLVAVPSLWGSGAETSPVAVADEAGRKVIRMGEAYLPDACAVWPELADSVPARLATAACGDAWAHALEGLLSPLADEAVTAGLASVVTVMRGLPLRSDGRWFEPSAAACRLQARSSVGLVHGIAHTLEGPLRSAQPDYDWGHARLCATFLWPVMALNFALSEQARAKVAAALDPESVLDVARGVFDADAYERALPTLAANWTGILRDPCTRTNGVLVRPPHLEHFLERRFIA